LLAAPASVAPAQPAFERQRELPHKNKKQTKSAIPIDMILLKLTTEISKVHFGRIFMSKAKGSLSIVGVNKIRNQVSAAGAKAPAAFLRSG
jgi:hypothetical protein